MATFWQFLSLSTGGDGGRDNDRGDNNNDDDDNSNSVDIPNAERSLFST